MPDNELLPYNCYTLHSLVNSTGQDMTRTSRFFVRPPPFIGPPVEPPSSHPHTLTPSQEDSHWVSFHFQQSCDELVWVTVVGKATIFLTLCLHSAVDELLWQCSNKPIRKPSENVSKGGTRLVYAVHQTLPSLAEVGLACKTR